MNRLNKCRDCQSFRKSIDRQRWTAIRAICSIFIDTHARCIYLLYWSINVMYNFAHRLLSIYDYSDDVDSSRDKNQFPMRASNQLCANSLPNNIKKKKKSFWFIFFSYPASYQNSIYWQSIVFNYNLDITLKFCD